MVADAGFDADVDFKELVDVEESLLVVVVTLADVVGGGTLESEVPYAVVEL